MTSFHMIFFPAGRPLSNCILPARTDRTSTSTSFARVTRPATGLTPCINERSMVVAAVPSLRFTAPVMLRAGSVALGVGRGASEQQCGLTLNQKLVIPNEPRALSIPADSIPQIRLDCSMGLDGLFRSQWYGFGCRCRLPMPFQGRLKQTN